MRTRTGRPLFDPFSHHRSPAEAEGLTDHAGRPIPVDLVTDDPAVELAYEGDPIPLPPPAADGRPPRAAPPAVVAVRPRTGSGWAVRRVNLTDRPQQIAGQLLGRTSLVVVNDGAAGATIGPDDSVTVGTHWPLAPAAERKLENTGAVWAVMPTGAVTTLVVLVEFDTDTGGA